jgi:hypothetical protein
MDADVLDQPLTEEQLAADGPLVEAAATRVIVPKKGKLFAEDGTCKIAIIRPCVSRGRRLGPNRLPPIYTPSMLAEHAGVFSGWLMYMDHLTEQIVEMLAERGRSIQELGGRITESYYDPEFKASYDDDFGYRPGAVVGRALPQPAVRTMLEADPEILHVSINAWPKGARPGSAPWDPSVKGMIVEGIRAKPEGSVDWVPRGGAGGRPLLEWSQQAVSILESYYDDPRGHNDMPTFTHLTRDSLAESLRRENPALAAELGLAEGSTPPVAAPAAVPAPAAPATPAVTLTLEEVENLLEDQRIELEAKLEEHVAQVPQVVEGAFSSRGRASELEAFAHQLIEGSGLPAVWQTDLKRRYAVLPSGPTPALRIQEADGVDPEQVIKEALTADFEHAATLIEAASGKKPRITGLGGGGSLQEGEQTGGGAAPASKNTAFRDFLRESGDSFGDKPEDFETGIREMVQEGVR